MHILEAALLLNLTRRPRDSSAGDLARQHADGMRSCLGPGIRLVVALAAIAVLVTVLGAAGAPRESAGVAQAAFSDAPGA
jgi:hypothetical protein